MMSKKISESDLEDKVLVCTDCGNKFIWTIGEQKFFLDKGLQNIPKRCKVCASKYKSRLREKHPVWWIKCKGCGRKAEVPFEPKSDDVYCQICFEEETKKRDEAIIALGEFTD